MSLVKVWCLTWTVGGNDVSERLVRRRLLVVVVLLLQLIHHGDDAVQSFCHVGPHPVLERPERESELHRHHCGLR